MVPYAAAFLQDPRLYRLRVLLQMIQQNFKPLPLLRKVRHGRHFPRQHDGRTVPVLALSLRIAAVLDNGRADFGEDPEPAPGICAMEVQPVPHFVVSVAHHDHIRFVPAANGDRRVGPVFQNLVDLVSVRDLPTAFLM